MIDLSAAPDGALAGALDLIRPAETCVLFAYPDPGSPLAQALVKRGLWYRYLAGKAQIPADLAKLSGAPWSIGWGETEGVEPDDVWTQDQADQRLLVRANQFMVGVLRRCPALLLEPPGRTAACTSLAYNIGLGAFGASSVCRLTNYQEFSRAADCFRLWNKSSGRVLDGLTLRRQAERAVYLI